MGVNGVVAVRQEAGHRMKVSFVQAFALRDSGWCMDGVESDGDSRGGSFVHARKNNSRPILISVKTALFR
jgi:hypothetical protein